MTTTLYLPKQPPQDVDIEKLGYLAPITNFASVPKGVSTLLGCTPELVDVLASGPSYVAYSVFDCKGESINEAAMRELAILTGMVFELDDEDTMLLGPVLIMYW